MFAPDDPEEEWEVDESECLLQGLRPPSPVRSCDGGICNAGFWMTEFTGVCVDTYSLIYII